MKRLLHYFVVAASILLFAAQAFAGELKLPKPRKAGLANGLTLIVLEEHSLPTVSMGLMFKSGSAYDPTDKAGLISLTLDLLKRGTEKKSALEFASAVDSLGGNISTAVGRDSARIYADFLSRDFEQGLALLAEMVRKPKLAEEELARLKQERIAELRNSKDSPRWLLSRHFRRLVYGDHPYRKPSGGTEKTVANIDHDFVVKVRDKFLIPNNAVLVIAGDISAGEARKVAKKYFDGWKKGPRPKRLPKTESSAKTRILLVDKPGLTQSYVALGHLGIRRNDPHYFDVMLMNYVLGGGGFASRLMDVIRTKMGLTYGINSSFNEMLIGGDFQIYSFTKNETSEKIVNASREVVGKFRKEGMTEKELKEARDYYLGSFPLQMETIDQIAEWLLDIELYNLGDDYLQRYAERLNGVTLESANKAAKEFVHPDKMITVFVGDAKKIGDEVKKLGEYETIKYTEFPL